MTQAPRRRGPAGPGPRARPAAASGSSCRLHLEPGRPAAGPPVPRSSVQTAAVQGLVVDQPAALVFGDHSNRAAAVPGDRGAAAQCEGARGAVWGSGARLQRKPLRYFGPKRLAVWQARENRGVCHAGFQVSGESEAV